MKAVSPAILLLLTLAAPPALAEHTQQTLQQAIANISTKDEDAEQKVRALLASLEQEPALAAQTLLFLMKVQLSQNHYNSDEESYQAVEVSYRQLVKLTDKLQLNKIQAEALFILAENKRKSGDSKTALKMLEEQVIPQVKAYAPELLGTVYKQAAHVVAIQTDLEKFSLYFDLAAESFKAENNFAELAEVLSIKGSYLASYGNVKLALPVLISASQYQLELDDNQALFTTYLALGRLYHEIGNYRQAIDYFEKGQALPGQVVKVRRASVHFSLAYSYYELQEYDQALAAIDKALSFIPTSANRYNLATILLGKASILVKQQNFAASLDILTQVRAIAAELKSERLDEDLQLNFAKYHLAVKALEPAKTAVQAALALETSHLAMSIDKYETASKIYKQAGDFKNAWLYLQKLRELELEKAKMKDEEHVVQQQNEINLLNAQKNTALVKQQLLEKQNQVQLQQAEQQQLWFYGSLLVLSLVGLFSFFYLRQSQKKRIALEQSKLIMAVMEQKNHFIANVAHDLKNPLTVIQVHLEALKDGMVKNPDKAHDILEQRLTDLTTSIDDLRQVSLLEMGTLALSPQPLVLRPWLQQEIAAYRPLVESKGLSFKTAVQLDRAASVIADPSRLSQVLANIIKNSLRYTGQPGKLTLIARQHGQIVEFIIKDSAPAVPENELENLFDHGYRSESTQGMSTQGSGLGLYICKEIIQAHQGSVRASLSNLGGLCISITLPLAGE